MRALRPLWLAFALALAPAAATSAGSDIAPAPFLWRIQGSHATHYLLGSVHLLPDSARQLPAALEDAFREASGGVVLETDLVALGSPQVQTRMLAASSAGGAGLAGEIGAQTYASVRRELAAAGFPETFCDSFRAWFCGFVVETTQYQKAGFSGGNGIDEHFLAEAQSLHRRVDWFEQPGPHIALYTDMPEDVARDFLLGTLDPDEKDSDSPQALLEMWRGNDTAGLSQLVETIAQRYPALYARMLGDRNSAWQPKIASLLDESEGRLIVVGAAHCVGSQGLVARLLARGVHVTPVGAGSPAAMHAPALPHAT